MSIFQTGKMEGTAFDLQSLPNCDGLFDLGREIGSGVASRVYTATEKRSGMERLTPGDYANPQFSNVQPFAGRPLAVKIVKITPETEQFLREECRILANLPKHDNVIDIYDLYLKTEKTYQEVWIVMEVLEYRNPPPSPCQQSKRLFRSFHLALLGNCYRLRPENATAISAGNGFAPVPHSKRTTPGKCFKQNSSK